MKAWLWPAGAAAVLAGMIAAPLLAQTLGASRTATARPAVPAVPAVKTAAADPARLPGYNPDRNAYFGDLHVHTSYSFDAFIFNVRATPDDAYRYGEGGVLKHPAGFEIRRTDAPLDFMAVTDHSENLGVIRTALDPNSRLGRLPLAKDLISDDPVKVQEAFAKMVRMRREGGTPPELSDPAVMKSAWADEQAAAARHYIPGRMTTFVAYEYTSAPDGRNLHRNVIFRGTHVPGMPYTATESQNPEDLWRAMDRWRAQGIEALAIPHNSNGSDGLMFDTAKYEGKPMDKAYAEMRIRNEPLVEITQVKGTSETHPSLSPNDEWANFEIMESYIGTDKKVTKFAGGYVRDALKFGIASQEKNGFNPYKLGIVGATDTHVAAAGGADEANYFSKVGILDATPERRGSVPPGHMMQWQDPDAVPAGSSTRFRYWGASGLTGVWAEQNDRESIYAAFRRKETFATSGPRIRVRFFAGYDLPDDLASRGDAVRQAYVHGVPMGGDLVGKAGRAPKFYLMAMRDPSGGWLQRAQIVKGWVENGQSKEQVFDVACSDGLRPDPKTARCPDNGATVDLKTCAVSRYKGDVSLGAVWRDPTFKPGQRAFYYVRILENPSCRWSTWDAIRNGTPPHPNLPTTIQERAWSSPIWYAPA